MYYKKVRAILDEAGVSPAIDLVSAGITNDGWACDKWRLTLEKGHIVEAFDHYTGLDLREGGAPSAPALLDVLYSLVCDERAVDADFASWCSDHGYTDSDSRKVRRMYKESVANGLRLRRIFGCGVIEELRELLEEY